MDACHWSHLGGLTTPADPGFWLRFRWLSAALACGPSSSARLSSGVPRRG